MGASKSGKSGNSMVSIFTKLISAAAVYLALPQSGQKYNS